MTHDFLIVGGGLTGATLARQLIDAGFRALVLERRPFAAGNIADHLHPSGVRVHRHGPHYFRTSSEQIWAFVNRFATFHPFAAVVRSRVDGRLENWPVSVSYIRRAVGETWEAPFKGTPANFEEAALSLMPRVIYEKFVKGYTEKQWGVPARTLSAALCKRFDVRLDDNPYLTPKARYQGIPVDGYSAMVENMLRGIPRLFNCDYLSDRTAFYPRRQTIFTGPIDEYFNYSLGRLAYRAQKRVVTYLPDVAWQQNCVQVNEPDPAAGPQIRTVEWKHLMPADAAARVTGTVLTTETPCDPVHPEDYEYPFPDDANQRLYQEYRKLAASERNVLFCGRLGEYRYYDMDQAIGRAMVIAKAILADKAAEAA